MDKKQDTFDNEALAEINVKLEQILQNQEQLFDLLGQIGSALVTFSKMNKVVHQDEIKNERHRDILARYGDVYITCVAGKKVLRFRLDIAKVEEFNKKKDKRIGRILPPYITCIQQSCASYITREGTMPTPVEVFSVI